MSEFEIKQKSFNEAVVKSFDDLKEIDNRRDKIVDILQNQISDLRHDLKVLSVMFFAVSFFFIIALIRPRNIQWRVTRHCATMGHETNRGNMKVKQIKNFIMNNETYKLRHKVVTLLYEIKESRKFSENRVRIGEARNHNTLGVAKLNKNKLITKEQLT